jgi:hypothetical protein
MSTSLTVRINYVDATVDYQTTAANYIDVDLTNDYIIWSDGSDTVTDLMTSEPTEDELNEASVTIDADADKEPNLCLLMDNSHDVGGAYYTHQLKGVGENKRYVYCFSFDGPTASEPTLEAWDDSNRNSTDKHVLGNGTPANSMVKAISTTSGSPGASWAGTAIAGSGSTRKINLNDGNGALGAVPSGQSTQELYANVKIVVPQDYANPAVESFVLTCRYTWN